jgi:DNA-binding FadR family transcriptional regulator
MTAAKKAQGLLFDIVHDIAADGLGPGDRLPSQAEMMRRYRAGPTPLREALRLLEFSGLVSLKPGPNAGAVLEPATAEHLAGLMAPFLSLAGVTHGQLLDAWAATEPLLAAAAAQNPDRALVTRELAVFAAEPQSDTPVSAAHAIDFHDAVARAAGNPALGLVLQVLSYVVADLYWASTDMLPPGGPVRHDHREIAEAILAGDADRARSAMEAHARDGADGILARVGHTRDEPFRWTGPRLGLATYRQRPTAMSAYAGGSAINGSAK